MKKILLIIILIIIPIFVSAQVSEPVNFSAGDIKGNTIELDEYKGKVVILDFWATWCPPCRREIPNLKEIYKTHKNDKFEIISIALERKPKDFAINFVKEWKMDWVHIIDMQKGREIAKKYKIMYIPTMYIINKKGEIVASGLRGEQLKKKIGELLLN
ncbi:MAG: TlpA disulfide reductase family protein [Acidobacteriota bacterium]